MWGFGIYIMRLVDYLQGRNARRPPIVGKGCRICGQNFGNEEQLDTHMRKEHAEMV
jgi:hypothetical protein